MYDIEQVKGIARGRWLDIVNACGMDLHGQHNKHQPCPICGDGWKRFRFDDKGGEGTWICNHCGAGDGLKLVDLYLGGFKRAIDFVAGYLGIQEAQEIDMVSLQQRKRDAERRRTELAALESIRRYGASMNAAQGAQLIMQHAVPSMGGHAYLIRKRIEGLTSWVMPESFMVPTSTGQVDINGSLVIPVINERRELVNCQVIKPNGKFKMFLLDGQITGCFHLHGRVRDGDTILIGEGFATMDTLKCIDYAVCVTAFNSGNLEAVARIIDYLYPNNKKLICADNDWHNNGKKCGNAGLTKGGMAALAIGCPMVYPPASEGVCDFNDYMVKYGVDELRKLF